MTESEANTILKAEIVHHPECSIFAEALGLAIQALEKQIQKKPIINHINTNEDVTEIEYTCSVCGTNFVELTPCEEWCPYCGNKLDWSDEE